MERTHDAALNDAPESFDGVRVNCTVDVLTGRVANGLVLSQSPDVAITVILIRTDQGNLMAYDFIHKGVQSGFTGVGNHAGYNVAFALNASNDNFFFVTCVPATRTAFAIPAVFVLRFAADKCFIAFHHANQLTEIRTGQGNANLVAHFERGIVRAETHVAHDLQGANTFLAGQHQVHDAEPVAQRFVRVLKDRTDQHRETIAVLVAGVAHPMPVTRAMFGHFTGSATRATHTYRPTVISQIGLAIIFVLKGFLELGNRHLMDLHYGLALGGHGVSAESGAIKP